MKTIEELAHDFAIAVVKSTNIERDSADQIVEFKLELYNSALKQFNNSKDNELNDRIESGNFSF
ncbi:hypothetical protein [Bacillus pumilus]|jgi:hypothetical protein|uniref:hypothetical protein n=1 Tax=Bacillus pumilus TaxID=1408 RepID=UPI00081FB944|nr:hypothetical protein [Bacillus pumilus]AOC55411.1 hypothetical protein BEN31_00750 [Bacillus pumilus]MBR0587107.1 hypothetical protein [Bacillus pumilus DW2J2]MBR0618507.1 hypothetical protein [Bacillus pumilus]MBR0624852.1 hypothetical protein [Bacillus pumilus]MCY7724735.1 hypothetical protein [Bacillus pumilus]